MIRLENIEKSFPTAMGTLPVLKGISLEVREGEFAAITGASGSGKSTLLALLGCLDRPTSGRILFDGVDLTKLNDDAEAELRGSSVGFVFQAFHLIQSLSLEENTEMPLFYAGVPRLERRRRALEALSEVGLAERRTHRPFELSGGEQQRAAIARALIRRPRLILADEPTGNLDSKTCGEIMAVFESLHTRGKTILMVTHDPGIASRAPRRIHLSDGSVETDTHRPAEG